MLNLQTVILSVILVNGFLPSVILLNVVALNLLQSNSVHSKLRSDFHPLSLILAVNDLH
jgi:hypothetical protein